jgi:SAM-dependent methyltransferase
MAGRIRRGSHRTTNALMFSLVTENLPAPRRLLDLGCGRGYFLRLLAEHYAARGWDPARHLHGADYDARSFEATEVPFTRLDLADPLPFPDGAFDEVISIEVFEHSPAPYALLAEVARILRPGGRLVFSVPNPMHAVSRLSFLLTGFYHMYLPPSAQPRNAGRLCGHIMPLPQQYWRYGFRRAGLEEAREFTDRARRGATFVAALLWPLFRLGTLAFLGKIRRYDAGVFAETAGDIRRANSWRSLTSRSLVFEVRRAERRAPAAPAAVEAAAASPAATGSRAPGATA